MSKQMTDFELLENEQIMSLTARGGDLFAMSNFGRLWRVFPVRETGVHNHGKEYWWAMLMPTKEHLKRPDTTTPNDGL